ncbi:radical SAM protein [bacterium]|nr:radical SAM protein [bacterium]
MARSGCKLISYGIESGDPDILASTRKNITLQQAEEAIRVSKEAGITFFAYFIVGLPGENWDTIRRTIDFAVRTDPDYALFHIATPFPGTTLFEQAAERGLILNQDWTTYDEEKGGAMRTEYLSAEEIVRARKLAMRRFYFRPSRVLRELGRIRSLSDLRSRLTAGLHILASS